MLNVYKEMCIQKHLQDVLEILTINSKDRTLLIEFYITKLSCYVSRLLDG